jgi:hypothetical protein
MSSELIDRNGNNSWDLADQYGSQGNGDDLAILVLVGTLDEGNFEPNVEWMAHLDSLGIAYSSFIVDGVGHEAADLYAKLGDSVMDFHEQCFSGVGGSR